MSWEVVILVEKRVVVVAECNFDNTQAVIFRVHSSFVSCAKSSVNFKPCCVCDFVHLISPLSGRSQSATDVKNYEPSKNKKQHIYELFYLDE